MSSSAMHVAKTGLNSQQTKMQVIANNLANVNTTGFKKDRVNFESLLYQIQRSSGEQTSADTDLASAFAVGTGVRIVNTQKLYTQGSLVNTDNALDLAIDGSGFFKFFSQMVESGLPEMAHFLVMLKVHLLHRAVILFSQRLLFQRVLQR